MTIKKLSFEESQTLYIEYMVDKIYFKCVYPALESSHMQILSYDEWIKPDLYYIDGVNKNELTKRFEEKEYTSSQIETFNEWFSKI